MPDASAGANRGIRSVVCERTERSFTTRRGAAEPGRLGSAPYSCTYSRCYGNGRRTRQRNGHPNRHSELSRYIKPRLRYGSAEDIDVIVGAWVATGELANAGPAAAPATLAAIFSAARASASLLSVFAIVTSSVPSCARNASADPIFDRLDMPGVWPPPVHTVPSSTRRVERHIADWYLASKPVDPLKFPVTLRRRAAGGCLIGSLPRRRTATPYQASPVTEVNSAKRMRTC
jgi:hypothetical protein